MKRVLPALLLAVGFCMPAFADDGHNSYTIFDAQRDNDRHLEMLGRAPVEKAGEETSDSYSRLDATQPAAGPAAATEVQKLVTKYAQKHGVNPALAHAIVKVESGYNCNAKNPTSSATGIMQTLVPTARGVGVTGNLRDCRTSLEAGMRYLKQAIDKHGEGCAGATAYNVGHYASSRCNGYGKKVMGIANRIDVPGASVAGLN